MDVAVAAMTNRDHAAMADPVRNPQFQRRWVDDPLGLPDFQHLGREVVPRVLEETGRRAIARWLNHAAQTQGTAATKAFSEADAIRRKMGLAWEDLIEQRSAA